MPSKPTRSAFDRKTRRISSLFNAVKRKPKPPSFMKLPTEIRLLIYNFLFDDEVTPHRSHESRRRKPWSRLTPPKRTALLCTCRQIRAEAEPVFYNRGHFAVTEMSMIPAEQAARVQIINVSTQAIMSMYELIPVLHALPNLQRLSASLCVCSGQGEPDIWRLCEASVLRNCRWHLPHLKHLHLYNMHQLDLGTVVRMLGKIPNLESLHIVFVGKTIRNHPAFTHDFVAKALLKLPYFMDLTFEFRLCTGGKPLGHTPRWAKEIMAEFGAP